MRWKDILIINCENVRMWTKAAMAYSTVLSRQSLTGNTLVYRSQQSRCLPLYLMMKEDASFKTL
jgi:hypothetical protein